MCGIAGVLVDSTGGAGGNDISSDLASRISRPLTHRGPDDEGAELIESGGSKLLLVHRRLSILDVTSAGHQPMRHGATGNWLNYNGEIYNFRELREELGKEGATFRSESDSEVLLEGYARWGGDVLSRLRGMFAFALWDAQKGELFIARDRLGIKPLYYMETPRHFAFASEVRTLLASGITPRSIDAQGIWNYLGFQACSGATLVKGVREVEPGSWMRIRPGGLIDRGRYWDLAEIMDAPSRADPGPGEAARLVRGALEEAVELHLESDVPVGAFLSGGLDSSAIVALMSQSGRAVKTFSMIFSESSYDEARFSRLIAARYATEHSEILLSPAHVLSEIPHAVSAMDLPTTDGINSFLVSGAVSRAGLKVALSGLGGDEWFGGYPSFVRIPRMIRFAGVIRSLAAVTPGNDFSVRRSKLKEVADSDFSIAALHSIQRQLFTVSQRRQILSPSFLERVDQTSDPFATRSRAMENRNVPPFSVISYSEAANYMRDVLLRDTDQMSMAHSLEIRVPFLDHRFVETVVSLPEQARQSDGRTKRLLGDAVNDLVPPEITRRSKQGFTLPLSEWMKGPLKEYCEARLDPHRIEQQGIFNAEQVSGLWRYFLGDKSGQSWSRVWGLVVLEDWLERHKLTIGGS